MTENFSRNIDQIKNRLLTPQPGVSPARQKVMVILVPVMFVVLIFVLGRIFGTSGAKARTTKEFVPAVKSFDALNDRVNWNKPESYPARLRDPMDPDSKDGEDGGRGNLVVRALLYSEDKPMAVVSEKVVGEGDVVLGATIVNINKDSVQFEMDGKRWLHKIRH